MVQRIDERQARSETREGVHGITEITGSRPGPLFVALGGIHGNEPAGVEAAKRVAAALAVRTKDLAGTVALLAGNTRALARGVRFVDADLNRRWAPNFVEGVRTGQAFASEDAEVRELLAVLDRLLEGATGEVYVVDMHTTSAQGVPFATLGDTLRNRAFAAHFPVPVILGIEEQLEGTLLEHLNTLGCITLGFEAGQHTAAESVDNHEALLWVALVAAGCLRREDAPEYDAQVARLVRAGGGLRFVEVRHRHAVRPGDGFRMEPGFVNFAPIRKGQLLARDWRGPILAPETGMVLMPLYQPLGDDGFFVARDVKAFWLRLSGVLRRLGVAEWVGRLPGVRPLAGTTGSLIVNTSVARLFPLQVFHLLGYRKRRWTDGLLVVSRRPFDRRGPGARA
jgi:succinylglutamate desuccinylase